MEHLGMADAIARRYHPRGQDWNDMRQVAYLGLVKAAERYDAGRSADFASFAVPTIAGELKRHLRDNGWAVRPPRALQELHHEVLRALPRIAQRLGRDPSAGELAESFGCDRSRILEALECGHGMNPLSLDVPARGADGDTLGEALGATSEELSRSELVQSMRSACRSLSGRERRILFLRFFHEKTQAQIADELGVTQVQVSRLLSKILTRLRRNLMGEDEAA
jgi:RNA polymerase sigma-B factor